MNRFLTTILCVVAFSLGMAATLSAHEYEQYFIDGSNSIFTYKGGVDPICRDAVCEFRLDGTFEAAVGEWGARYRNVSLSISGDVESTSSIVAEAEGAFLAAKPNGLLPGQVGHPVRLGFVVDSNQSLAGGSTLLLRAGAVSQSALDCDNDGNLSLADINCLAGQENFDAAFSALDIQPGDFNGDGTVAFDDFLKVSSQFGQSGKYTDGDADGNGTVQFGDFLIVSSNFGSVGTASVVPEPSTTTWLPLLVLLGVFCRTKRAVR